MFQGLSAFPLTPMDEHGVDERAFARLVARLAEAGVDSIGALGSTGNYAYLSREERARVARLAVEHAGDTPVIIGVGALRSREVIALAEDAQRAGARGLLLAPMSYQLLTEEEVYQLFAELSSACELPLCLYDNPGTTHFHFNPELYARIAALPTLHSIKMPGGALNPDTAAAQLAQLRPRLPERVTLGASNDPFCSDAMLAGCEVWYSVFGGLFPTTALAICRAAERGDSATATELNGRLAPLWELFKRHGSLRVAAALAAQLGLLTPPALPRPLLPIPADAQASLPALIDTLELA